MKRYAFALGVLALAACARPVAPQGGPKDTTPPAVVPEKSTPNMTTRFAEREFHLSFDEWVTLQDVGAQVLVSPPLAKRPEVTLKGHTVTFKFDKDEVLRPNTTYTINFGTSVKDLHEGNPAQDLRFVFSTGDVIDSLSVAGPVVDAFSGEPLENIAVMLYDAELADSAVRKERPYYLARTDKAGQFSIANVRAGAFRCVAIDDANQNLKWDGEAERIGFPDSLLAVTDSLSVLPAIRLFRLAPTPRLLAPNANQYGLIKLGYSALPDSLPLQPSLPDLRWISERDQDTLLLWYERPDSVAWELIAGPDTVPVRALSRAGFLADNQVGFADERVAAPSKSLKRQTAAPPPAAGPRPPQVVNIRPAKPVTLRFRTPVSRIDTSKCLLVRADSLEIRDFTLLPDAASPRALRLDIPWLEGQRYTLTLLPDAVVDFYGVANSDTLRRIFVVPEEKQLGSLNLSIEGLTDSMAYILRLMNGNTVEEERLFTALAPETTFLLPQLQPATYAVQLIEDRNANGRWDPGDYFANRQPERVFIKKLDALRANWELKAVLDLAKRN